MTSPVSQEALGYGEGAPGDARRSQIALRTSLFTITWLLPSPNEATGISQPPAADCKARGSSAERVRGSSPQLYLYLHVLRAVP